jgi:hypothetical protein
MVELDLRNNNARLEYQRGNGEKPLNLDVKNSDHERIVTSTQISTMSMRTPGRKTISICASREENFMACHHEKFTLILSDIDGILSTAKLSYISGVPDFYPLVVVDFSAEPMICTFVNQ